MAKKNSKKFAVWAAEWLKQIKPTVKGNTFAASYRNPVEKHLIPYFGKKWLDDVRQTDIQRYVNLIAARYAHDTVKKHKSCLFQIFETAVENGFCERNPVRLIKIRCAREPEEKYVYTEEQELLVFKYGYLHRFGAEIQFMLATAVSRSELLAVRHSDIDLENRAVHIRHGAAIVPNEKTGKQEVIIGDTKNSYRRREIPLEDEICQVLKNLTQRSEYVFCNSRGTVCNPRTWQRRHFDVFMQDMKNYYARKGIDVPVVNPHQLRHTRLSQMVNSGKNPIAVAKFGGHASMNMLLKRYVHSSVDELREQLDMK